MSLRRAAFLDRDGTLIADAHYLADPDGVRLLEGAAEAVRHLNDRGVAVVVVTNQGGIARGMITPAQYEATAARVHSLFAARGARLDACYHCPHHPAVTGPCDCRKPGAGLHRRAARELGLALVGAACVGDRRRDLEPARAFGGTGILVPSPDTPDEEVEWARAHAAVTPTLLEAITLSRVDDPSWSPVG